MLLHTPLVLWRIAMRWIARLLERRILRAALLLTSAATACSGAGLLDSPAPDHLPSIFHFAERFVQRGISSGDLSLLVPDEPFELSWMTSGIEGRVVVAVSTVSDGVAVVRARLEFTIPAGCDAPHRVRVSSLPAGYVYLLDLTVTASDYPSNPCPNSGHDLVSSHWHPAVSFREIPVSATPLSDMTITRLAAP
jgi:hypothetical protein